MLKFKYRMKPSIARLVRENVDYNNDYLVGYMESGMSKYQLYMSRLYLVCEELNHESTKVDEVGNVNPIAIVAQNEYNAVYLFNKITGKEHCNVLTELELRCDELKVIVED